MSDLKTASPPASASDCPKRAIGAGMFRSFDKVAVDQSVIDVLDEAVLRAPVLCADMYERDLVVHDHSGNRSPLPITDAPQNSCDLVCDNGRYTVHIDNKLYPETFSRTFVFSPRDTERADVCRASVWISVLPTETRSKPFDLPIGRWYVSLAKEVDISRQCVRMYEMFLNQQLVDTHLRFHNGARVGVHRVVFAALSDVAEKMLTVGQTVFKKHDPPEISLPDATPTTVAWFIRFLYLHRLPSCLQMDWSTMAGLFSLIDTFGLGGELDEAFVERFGFLLDSTNIFDAIKFRQTFAGSFRKPHLAAVDKYLHGFLIRQPLSFFLKVLP